MDTKSEILSEEHLRTVSWYWLYMYNLHVPPACRMIRLRVEDDRHLYPSLCMTVRSELTRSALVTRCDISIVTGLAIYIWNEGSFDNIMFRVIAFLEVQVRVFPEIVSEMHTWLVLKHVRNSIYIYTCKVLCAVSWADILLHHSVKHQTSLENHWPLLGTGVQYISTWLFAQDVVQEDGVLWYSSAASGYGWCSPGKY